MNITKRLQRVMLEGNLSISDLARWFGRPFATVRGWTRGRDMNGPEGNRVLVLERLKLIERRIRLRAGLPVPQFPPGKMGAPSLRIAYLNKLMAKKRL